MFGHTFVSGGGGGGGGKQILFTAGLVPGGAAGSNVVGAGLLRYINPTAPGIFSGAGRAIIFPLACIVKNFYFVTGSAQPASGNLNVNVYQNNVPSLLGFIIPANGAAATYSDLTNVLTIAAGDSITIAIQNNAAANSALIQGISIEVNY